MWTLCGGTQAVANNHFHFILFSFRNHEYLNRTQSVRFSGVSRDQVSFDSNGNGVGAYDLTVVNMDTETWVSIGRWISNVSNVLEIPDDGRFLDIDLASLKMLWKKVFVSSEQPSSVCGKECPAGYFMALEDKHPVSFSFLPMSRNAPNYMHTLFCHPTRNLPLRLNLCYLFPTISRYG